MSTPPTPTIEAEEQIQALEELREFLAIPSISTLAAHKDDIQRAAEWVAGYFTRAGLDHIHIIPTDGHPLVYADWLHAPGKPTLLIYGHYDVQPPDPLDAWHSPPFEPAHLVSPRPAPQARLPRSTGVPSASGAAGGEGATIFSNASFFLHSYQALLSALSSVLSGAAIAVQ